MVSAMTKKVCKICNKDMDLHQNRSGVVIDNKFFICEQCHETADVEEEGFDLSSIMSAKHKEMPIALWMIQEQNKDKTFMSIKKR